MAEITPGIPDAESLLEHLPRVRALARELLGDEHRADDLAQEVWLRASESEVPVRSLTAWLNGIARNVAYKMQRGERRRRAREQASARPELHDSDPESVALALEAHARLAAAIHRLPISLRWVIYLEYFELLDTASIARRTGVPASTVRSRRSRALERLREDLGRTDHDDRVWSGLALLAVRPDRVLVSGASAASAASASAAATILGGVIVSMKSVLSIVAIGLVVLAAWWWQQDPIGSSPPEEGAGVRQLDGFADKAHAVTPEDQIAPLRDTPSEERRTRPSVPGLVCVVQNRAGRPIPGALVRGYGDPVRIGLDAQAHSLASGRTDQNGEAVLPQAVRLVEAVADSFSPGCVHRVPGMNRLVIVLGEGHRLWGRCMDEAGEPLASVSVSVSNRGVGSETITVLTDQFGRYSIEGAPYGKLLLVADKPDFCRSADSVIVSAPGQTECDLVLSSGATARGIVRDASTSAAIEGARVSASRAGAGRVTGIDGSFEIGGLVNQLWVSAPGYATVAVPVVSPSAEYRNVELTRELRVEGRIVGSDGPLANAQVSVAGRVPGRWAVGAPVDEAFAVTDSDGTFEILGLNPEVEYAMCVSASGYARRLLPLATRRGESVSVGEVSLRPGATVRLRLTSQDRGPIPHCLVQVSLPLPDGFFPKSSKRPVCSPALRVMLAYTDSDGVCTLTGLENGSYEFVAADSGLPRRVKHMVDVVNGYQEVDWRIEGLGLTGYIPEGEREGNRVELVLSSSAGGNRLARVVTGLDGSFGFWGLPEGEFLLSYRSGPRVGETTVTAGTHALRLEFHDKQGPSIAPAPETGETEPER